MSMAASDYLESDRGRQAGVTSVVHKRPGLPFRVISRPYRLSAELFARLPFLARIRGARLGERHEASPKNISASGRGRRRAPGDVAHRNGASLSDAADHDCRALPGGRAHRYARANPCRACAGVARPARDHRERVGCGRQHRRGSGRARRACWLHRQARHWQSHVLNGASYQLPYDVVKDFEPVSLLADTPQWIVARKTLPAKDLSELIAWLKENPGKATAGTVGVGGPEITGIYFQKTTGTSFQFVPYRGGAPLNQDMLAGHIDFGFGQAASTFVHVRNGNLKAYAVMAKRRWAAAPDVPTIDEAGVPGLYASFWHGLWVPKGTPTEPIARLNSAVQAALADATVRQRFADQGQDVPAREQQTPEALAAQQKAEIEKWWPILKAANIKGE